MKRSSANSTTSAIMARIRGCDTNPELTLRRELWRRGFRYLLHKRIDGVRPDIVFPQCRVAVFIDGCFWHGCPEHYVVPRSRQGFWAQKLASNTHRDRTQTIKLERQGWVVLRFWEHEIARHLDNVAAVVERSVNERKGSHRREVSWIVVAVEQLSKDGTFERRHLQNLRDPNMIRVEERMRSTKKW